MSVEIIGSIAFVSRCGFAFAGIYHDPVFTVHLFACSTLLGASAGGIVAALGFASLSPAHRRLGCLRGRPLSGRKIASEAAEAVKPGRPNCGLGFSDAFSLVTAYPLPSRAPNRYTKAFQLANSNPAEPTWPAISGARLLFPLSRRRGLEPAS